MASIHETVKDLHSAGVMTDQTVREFDALCLTLVQQLTPPRTKRTEGMVIEKAKAAS